MKSNVLDNKYTDRSPCSGCKYEREDKNECSDSCRALQKYQQGQAYSDIDRYRKVEPAMRDEAVEVFPDIVPEELEQKPEVAIPAPINDVKKCLICGREESDKVKTRRGLCISPCYQNWRQGKLTHPVIGAWRKQTRQELNEARHGKFKECLIEGCEKTGNWRGLCQVHYKSWSKKRILHPKIGEFFPKRKTKNKMIIVEKSLKHEKEENALKEGRKEIDNKIDWSCIPMETLSGVAKVFEQGAIKYGGTRTWLPGIKFSKLCSAIVRHLVSWYYLKEDIDHESGESHLSHIIANCLMLLTFKDNNNFDDR